MDYLSRVLFVAMCLVFRLIFLWPSVLHYIRLTALVCHLGVQGFSGELVSPLALLVIQQHHSVHCTNSELGIIRCPGHARYFGSTIL